MTLNLVALISGYATSSGLIIAIGAQNAFVLTQSIKGQYGYIMALICAVIDIILISAGMLGMGQMIAQFPMLEPILLCVGAVFLIYLGANALKRAVTAQEKLEIGQAEKQRLWPLIMICLAVSLLNPHVYLDTVILLGSIGTSFPEDQQMSFMIGAYFGSVIWFSALVIIGRVSRSLFQKPLAWKILDFCVAAMMFFVSSLLIHQFLTTYMHSAWT